MASWDGIGRSIDRMGWPERIVWVLFTFGGTTVLTVGNYNFEVSGPGKVFFVALFWLIICAAFYYRLGWLERASIRAERRNVALSSASAVEEFPDWPIRELFFHIDPYVLESDCEVIGRVVLDELSMGRLAASGRRYLGTPEATKRGSSSIPIPRDHWDGVDFTYFFFADDEEHRYAPHTAPPARSSIPEYADLKVNKAQAQGIQWSRHVMIDLQTAASKAYEETRGTTFALAAERGGGPEEVVVFYCNWLCVHVRIFGNRPPSSKVVEIPKSDLTQSVYLFDWHEGSLVAKYRYGDGFYENLKVRSDELRKAIAALFNGGRDTQASEAKS